MRKLLLLSAVFVSLALSACLTSCNVTRTVTNESKYTTKGDTSVVITTKTVETYDGRKYHSYY